MALFDLAPTTIPVAGGDAFPVRRIYCVGQNYAAHAREMGVDPARESPVFFQKPADAVQPVAPGSVVAHAYPPLTAEYHPEVELVVALGAGGRDLPAGLEPVFGYAVGLDMTRRDRQREQKSAGRPWEVAKAFDHSAPIGPIVPAQTLGHPAAGAITLAVNGTIRQRGDLADLIWSVSALIAELSRGVELKAGDLIFTGTPAGVGPVERGDRIVAKIDGLPDVSLEIV